MHLSPKCKSLLAPWIGLWIASLATVTFAQSTDRRTGAEGQSSPMNVVFILVDDLGKHDLSIEGSTFYETDRKSVV